ncbi:hypothetical protein CW745_11515 [Psychromonas sp. psych-6C06]|uniref:hypothetical protein n=1 Tax=Psychromonas sp. psych-6C06 TaxID=2058089 RepID=UPI000C32AE13|nr:hypothetical protein [Psychromonas sp. psych-6C06]PKF61253.1 hypothetical protein CW745_11515 [Psychromonas sp. psych-6C06]
MYTPFAVGFLVVLLSACNPFSGDGKANSNNQFMMKKNKLYFDGHELTEWKNKAIPHCEQCSFNLYTKKMLPGAMLFRQVNNPRGDLLFLSASNIRYGFALQAGGDSHSVRINKKEGEMMMVVDSTITHALIKDMPVTIRLGQDSFNVVLKKIDSKKEAIDLVIWREMSNSS